MTRPAAILWADTFNNYFFPHTARAAADVLESAGYRVEVPMQHLCCGRSPFDYGMLNEAKSKVQEILSVLQPAYSDWNASCGTRAELRLGLP